MNGVYPGRLAQHVPELRRRRERLLVLRDDHVGEVPEVLRRARRLPLGLGDGQPGVERLRRRDPLAPRLDPVRDPVQDPRPGPRRHPRPRPPRERLDRRLHGLVDVVHVAGRRPRVHPVAHGIGDPERAAADARHVPPADEVLNLIRRRQAGLAGWLRLGHGLPPIIIPNDCVLRLTATPRPRRQ
jgi:hypothetical protein